MVKLACQVGVTKDGKIQSQLGKSQCHENLGEDIPFSTPTWLENSP